MNGPSFRGRVWSALWSTRLLWTLAAVGYGARLLIWWMSEGSNDIRTWRTFGNLVSVYGLGHTYTLNSGFNHPPLMGLWGAVVYRWQKAEIAGLMFAHLFKIPSLLAEFGIGALLFSIWKKRGSPRLAVAAVAAYAVSLSSILISAYHGNTDAMYFFFALLAAYFFETGERAFLAGLSIGLALNVKLIPVVVLAPLATRCRNLKQLVFYVLGGAVAAIPFAVALVRFSSPQRSAFLLNVFGYGSQPEYWGVELWLRSLRLATRYSLPSWELALGGLDQWYLLHGGAVLMVLSFLFAAFLMAFARRSFDAYRILALCFAGFLVAASGFGVQYTGCVVAPFLAFWLFGGSLVGFTTGVLILLIYALYVITWHPIASQHGHFPADLSGVAAVAWLSLIYVIYKVRK